MVAATGTGKTVVAAFDYRRLCIQQGGQPRLLFVAHREEILRQALRTYREVLRDHTFGALLAGGMEPESFDHLFATIDSVASRDLLARRGAGHWHAVVVDECHLSISETRKDIIEHYDGKVVIGFTATPARGDGRARAPAYARRNRAIARFGLRAGHRPDAREAHRAAIW